MPVFDTPEPISVTIDVAAGDIRVSASDRDTTIVEVRPTDASRKEDVRAAEQTRVEHADARLLIDGPKAGSSLVRRTGSIDVTIELPARSDVHGTLGAGDFHTDGWLGDCRCKTGAGRIRLDRADTLDLKVGAGEIVVDRAMGHAEVAVGAGDVRLRELGGSAVVKNSTGSTWVGEARGDLRIKAATGDIVVDVAHAGVRAKSANGDVRLGDVARGSIVLETQLGDLEVGVREGTTAWLDVDARFGRLHNSLDTAAAPDPSAEIVEVRARTSIGEIVIRRP